MSWFNKWGGQSNVVGLDMGSHTLKLASLIPKKSSFVLDALHTVSLPHGTIVDGDILDSLTLEKGIQELFSNEKKGSKSIAFAVSGSAVFSKKITIPFLSEKELEDKLIVIAAQYVPFPIEEANMDYQLLSPLQDKTQELDLVITAVKKKFLENYVSLLKTCNLKPAVVDTVATALANTFSLAYPNQKSAVLIHIGACLTQIVVIEKGVPVFSDAISAGGNNISYNIREKLKLSFQEADALKINCTKDQHLPEETMVAVKEACDHLYNDIQLSLNSYVRQFPQSHIEAIYLSGGSAKIVPLIEWLSNSLSLKVSYLNPWNFISYDPKKFRQSELEELSLMMPVALGLASRSKAHD